MKRWLGYVIAIVMLALSGLGSAAAQKSPRPGKVIIPPSNVLRPQDVGKRMHTNFLIFIPGDTNGKKPSPQSSIWIGGETPSSMACVYQTGPTPAPGCPISGGNYDNPVGGSRMIAIVDAYDYPTAASDFVTFSQQFGLPSGNACGAGGNAACFTTVYAAGTQPQSNCGWAQEAALDIEWAHAMAPKAQIVLVEAASNSFSDLFTAVNKASTLVANAGGGQVSMSWGGSEFSSESLYDSYFTKSGVTYFASSGDTGGVVIYPSASPNVISAGGTTVNRDGSGNFTGESAWSSAGAGPSAYEPAPDYQSSIYTLANLLNGYRGTADYSFDANPASGVSVYDSTSCQGYVGWLVFGGTSVASPSLAGIFNLAGAFDGGWANGTNTTSVQNNLYQNYDAASSGGTVCNYQSPFYDVTSGSAGSFPTGACWDFATGIGSGRGVTGLTASAGFSLSSSPSSLTVDQGSGATYTVNVSYSGGFAGTVDLSASGLPTGASATFSPTSLTAPGSSTMSVTTGSGTPAGTYSITITGTSGSVSQTATATLVVNSTSSGDFSLSTLPSSQTVTQGGGASYDVTVTGSGGFSGTVGFSVSGLPSGAGASFSPTSVSGSGSTTMSVTTGSTTPTGTYTLTITASSGSLSHSTTVTLQVNAASSGSFTLGASSATITVDVNSSISDSITVTPSGGFTGSVSLSLSGLPRRTSSSFSANPVSITSSSSASSVLTISTNKRTSTGTYPLTITATSGSLTQKFDLTLVVGSTSSPDFSISASPSSQTVSPGSGTSYTVNVSASGGFTDSVGFSVTGLPNGATPSFSPTSVSGGSGQSTLSIATTGSTPTGTYNLTITGASPSLTHSKTVTLVVGTSSGGDFSLSALPSTQSVSAGSSASYTVTVGALNGFSGTVALSASSLPPHSSASFSPASVTGGSGTPTMTVNTAHNTRKNTYSITIKGTSGSLSHSTTVQIVVQ
jgi:uncharacterized membrane protein